MRYHQLPNPGIGYEQLRSKLAIAVNFAMAHQSAATKLELAGCLVVAHTALLNDTGLKVSDLPFPGMNYQDLRKCLAHHVSRASVFSDGPTRQKIATCIQAAIVELGGGGLLGTAPTLTGGVTLFGPNKKTGAGFIDGSTGDGLGFFFLPPNLFSGTAPIVISYQWVKNGVDIVGATSADYIVSAGDAFNSLINCRVIGTNQAGTASTLGNASIKIIDATLAPNAPTAMSVTNSATPGEINVNFTKGVQIAGNPDTSYTIGARNTTLNTFTNFTKNVDGAHVLTGLVAGPYEITISTTNAITTTYAYIAGTGTVV